MPFQQAGHPGLVGERAVVDDDAGVRRGKAGEAGGPALALAYELRADASTVQAEGDDAEHEDLDIRRIARDPDEPADLPVRRLDHGDVARAVDRGLRPPVPEPFGGRRSKAHERLGLLVHERRNLLGITLRRGPKSESRRQGHGRIVTGAGHAS